MYIWADFHGNEAKKIYFFWKKKFKMADSKKAHFSKSPILKIFSRKFLRFVLGLVGLNDAKGIDVAQCIWPWGCPTKAQKQPKNPFLVLSRKFLAMRNIALYSVSKFLKLVNFEIHCDLTRIMRELTYGARKYSRFFSSNHSEKSFTSVMKRISNY